LLKFFLPQVKEINRTIKSSKVPSSLAHNQRFYYNSIIATTMDWMMIEGGEGKKSITKFSTDWFFSFISSTSSSCALDLPLFRK